MTELIICPLYASERTLGPLVERRKEAMTMTFFNPISPSSVRNPG
jgi:hypothetical protein